MSGAEAKFAFSYASRGAVAEIGLSHLVTHIASPVGRLAPFHPRSRAVSSARLGREESLPSSVIPAAWRRDFNARARSPWRRAHRRHRNLLDKGVELDALAKSNLVKRSGRLLNGRGVSFCFIGGDLEKNTNFEGPLVDALRCFRA